MSLECASMARPDPAAGARIHVAPPHADDLVARVAAPRVASESLRHGAPDRSVARPGRQRVCNFVQDAVEDLPGRVALDEHAGEPDAPIGRDALSERVDAARPLEGPGPRSLSAPSARFQQAVVPHQAPRQLLGVCEIQRWPPASSIDTSLGRKGGSFKGSIVQGLAAARRVSARSSPWSEPVVSSRAPSPEPRAPSPEPRAPSPDLCALPFAVQPTILLYSIAVYFLISKGFFLVWLGGVTPPRRT